MNRGAAPCLSVRLKEKKIVSNFRSCKATVGESKHKNMELEISTSPLSAHQTAAVSAVPLLFGLLWPEDVLSLLGPLGAKLCFWSLWSCMEYSARIKNTSTLEENHIADQ